MILVLVFKDASGSSHARMVRYLKDMKLIVRLHTDENGAAVKDGVFIYPPLLVAHYSTAHWRDFEADRYVKVKNDNSWMEAITTDFMHNCTVNSKA